MATATQTQKTNFINSIAPLIQVECAKRGWGVPSAIIAQSILESNWGLSGLAKYHNYFGLKCGTVWKGASVNMQTKEEYTVGTLTTIRDNFRCFSSMAEGVSGYFDFCSTTRYAKARSCTDARTYITVLGQCGYYTSSTYVNSIMNVISQFQLQKYDDTTFVATDKSVVFTTGDKYTVYVNLNVRSAPFTDCDILKKYTPGTSITCLELKTVNDTKWLRTKDGWICTGIGGKNYIG